MIVAENLIVGAGVDGETDGVSVGNDRSTVSTTLGLIVTGLVTVTGVA